MDIGKALTYVTEDERWVTKLGIGAAMAFFSFLIIPAFFLTGYMVQIAQNVMAGHERPLPEWQDWGKLFMDGLNLFVAMLVYTLPFWLLTCCVLFTTVGSSGLSEMSEDAAAALLSGSFLLFCCVFFIWIVALMFLAPAVTIQYARERSLGACFQFSRVIGIARDNIGDIVLTVAVSIGISFVLGLVGSIPIIGWLIILAGNVYVYAVLGHLYGQIGAKMDGGISKEDQFAM
ncbi:MAG: DUF4013 domain-containing protein [Chloroflexi bacterium]|nr:DUF4013 domain-containing protein [Ardenticatenaceae bacterium]MBL1129341.1 DUF4013 domain-containing protein [Chloroflexota bacterium]NOG35419.1 DUF4013 domain-containing protein [Chloroflexota bacterium]GIK58651.1 MAG: hypothetical protein BroJett015_43140 [Chloroflexota bacterium]